MEDGGENALANSAVGMDAAPSVCVAEVQADQPNAVAALAQRLGPGPFSLVTVFASPAGPFDQIAADTAGAFGQADVIACTTAGEIGARGYQEGSLIAIGFRAERFATTALMIEDLDRIDPQPLIDRVTRARVALQEGHPDKRHGFAFQVVDGLSLREDVLTGALSPALGDMPLFGGSAGDGVAFEKTLVALNGDVRSRAAVVALVRTDQRVRVFSLDHLVPTDERMVVTEADPDRRIVKSINAEPAAREYARIVGKDPDQLSPLTFAAHPVVVRIGGAHHVRAIQRVSDGGELVFFSAIDEGMVLTVAKPQQIALHLDRKLTALAAHGQPTAILGCDCILRRIEAEQMQVSRNVSDVLVAHRVVGFSTYGEQIGPLHVNHTMTGVAIYPPADRTRLGP